MLSIDKALEIAHNLKNKKVSAMEFTKDKLLRVLQVLEKEDQAYSEDKLCGFNFSQNCGCPGEISVIKNALKMHE